MHRQGSNVVNGRYYVDYSPDRTPAHYSAFRRLDVAGLRTQYEQLRAMSRAEATAGSPLMAGPGARAAAAILRGRSQAAAPPSPRR